MQGLSTVIAGVFRSQERSVREEKRKMMLTQEKKLKLADCYLAWDIGREEYVSLKSRYETELESYRLNQISLNKSCSENKASEALRIAAALAAGEDDETDFYLSLVKRIEIYDSSQIAIILENSPGEWVVEFL